MLGGVGVNRQRKTNLLLPWPGGTAGRRANTAAMDWGAEGEGEGEGKAVAGGFVAAFFSDNGLLRGLAGATAPLVFAVAVGTERSLPKVGTGRSNEGAMGAF